MRAQRFGRRAVLLGAGALALTAACAGGKSGSGESGTDTVTTASGPVRGTRRATGVAFLGIPFAQPPVGQLRFAAPQPPTPWAETRDCTRYGPTAQIKQLAEVTAIPEPSIPGDDILTVNVFTPTPDKNAKLPVLVWIHGGGFVAGSPASPWYDGAAFNRDGVVLVSVGYRLGLAGFLHLDDAPDNRAVLDWIAALTWVRDNIAAFGGDPAKVTIAGQSAGGGAVWALMNTPAAKGLFRAGISESGAVTQPNDKATALALSAQFTRRTGLPATAAALRDLSKIQLQDLEDKLRAPGPDSTPAALLGLAPFADGTLIPSPSAELLKSGADQDVPLMIGFTAHEFNGASLTGAQTEVTDTTLPMALGALGFAPAAAADFRTAYPGLTANQLAGQAQSDAVIRMPSFRVAEMRAGRDQPTWLYEFTWTSNAPKFQGMSFHCLDVPFAFDVLRKDGVTAVAGDNAPQSLADAIHRAWVNFVRDGDPGTGWPRYTLDRRETMIWSAAPQVQSDPFAAQRPIWLR
ncbi:carboxylesterase/lipase family protein [Nocardia yunnanensis]|uniref:Carboxylic ester hydrolase n=1 Tax=Nocardia yunnanensis TaxID=2382165 RepID=A0A386Z9D1_9NOCA|nr:carboxylesterase family protein [Nocardia yunnanensis]AYF74260.1 carboxylesterase/lipase family protein [Nocardia yunnanensis]